MIPPFFPGSSLIAVKAEPNTRRMIAAAPMIFPILPDHSPKAKTPINEVPTNCNAVEIGIVLETPIKLKDVYCPVCPMTQNAPESKLIKNVVTEIPAGEANN